MIVIKERLVVSEFDSESSYDVYFELADSVKVARNVRMTQVRAWSWSDDDEEPEMTFLELVDSKGRRCWVDTATISLICPAGTEPPVESAALWDQPG
jgi:hypothetical protein